MLTLVCAALAGPTLHDQALQTDDPEVAERLLRTAVDELTGDELHSAQLDLARVLGPTAEAFALIDPLLHSDHPAAALRAHADLSWASDQRDAALTSWTKALEHDPTPKARERLAWRYLVATEPLDGEAIDASLSVRGIHRVAVQRALRIGEEVIVLGSSTPHAIQIRPATARWTSTSSLSQADVLARLPEDPHLTTRFLIGATDWTAVERMTDGPSLLSRLTNRPAAVRAPVESGSRSRWPLLGGLLLVGCLLLVGVTWTRR